MNLIYIKLEGERYVKTFRNDKPKSNLAKYLSKNKEYEYERKSAQTYPAPSYRWLPLDSENVLYAAQSW